MGPGMMGAGAMSLWWVVGLVLLVAVIGVGVALGVRAIRARDRLGTSGRAPRELGERTGARRLLDDRYARGELDSEEYRERVITLDDQR